MTAYFDHRSSNLDKFINMLNLAVSKPEKRLSIDDIRQTLYVSKIIGLFWFDGELPASPTETFTIYINSHWPDPKILPPSIKGIMQNLSLGELQFISNHLEKPKWICEHGTIKNHVSCQSMVNQ